MRKIFTFIICLIASISFAQEQVFFSEGTDATFYDQGIVDKANLGDVIFDHVAPPCCPEYDDKLPCSAVAHTGSTSLKFHYTTSPTNVVGVWKASVFRNDWADIDVTGNNYLSFYLYSTTAISKDKLPKIGLKVRRIDDNSEEDTEYYDIAAYNNDIPANTWVKVGLPLSVIIDGVPSDTYNFTKTKAVVFRQNSEDTGERTLYIDDIKTSTEEISTGILESYNAQVTLSPNPVESTTELIMPSEFHNEKLQLSIYNATGVAVYQTTTKGETRVQLDLSSYGSGLYFLQISNDKENIVKKLIKK